VTSYVISSALTQDKSKQHSIDEKNKLRGEGLWKVEQRFNGVGPGQHNHGTGYHGVDHGCCDGTSKQRGKWLKTLSITAIFVNTLRWEKRKGRKAIDMPLYACFPRI
jgi:hypothetical protein